MKTSKHSRRLVRSSRQKGGVKKRLARSERNLARKRSGRRDTAIVKAQPISVAEAVEKVLITGDLTPLTSEQRLEYYNAVCKSLGLNPLTRPFEYIVFRENDNAPAKLQLYARKDCGEQLRGIHGVSVLSLKREILDETCIVEVMVRDKLGKTDVGTGVVSLIKWDKYVKPPEWVKLKGREYDNALMKCETKAKRRATLAICGLGFLDETEIEGLANYNELSPGGRVIVQDGQPTQRQLAQEIGTAKVTELTQKAETPSPEPPKRKEPIVRRVEIRTLVGDEFAVTGYLEDIQMERFLSDVAAKPFKANADGRLWHRMEDHYRSGFDTLCKKLELEVA